MRCRSQSGFALLETLIAAVLFAIAVVGLVHVLAGVGEQSIRTEIGTVSHGLAQSKLEELHSAAFAYDDAGLRVEHSTLGLTAADAHARDEGTSEQLDAFGNIVVGAAPSYVRRWSIVAHDSDEDSRLVTVCVSRVAPASALLPACVWAVRARQP